MRYLLSRKYFSIRDFFLERENNLARIYLREYIFKLIIRDTFSFKIYNFSRANNRMQQAHYQRIDIFKLEKSHFNLNLNLKILLKKNVLYFGHSHHGQ